MKKVLGVVVAVILLGYGISFAAGASDLYNVKKGPTILHRDTRTTADTTIPNSDVTLLDMSNYQYAICDVVMNRAEPSIAFSIILTPIFLTASSPTAYASGASVTATENSRLKVEVNGSQGFYVKIGAMTASNVSVFVTGTTE